MFHIAIEQEYERKNNNKFMITIWIDHKTMYRRVLRDPRLFGEAIVIFGSTEKQNWVDYAQLLRVVYFSCFQGHLFLNIVEVVR